MSILTQNNADEKALLDCIQRFFSNHHVGMILTKCNGTKEKGVPSISLLRYKLGNIFVGRSMYMPITSTKEKILISRRFIPKTRSVVDVQDIFLA